MASLKITHFWSNLIGWGYQRIFLYGGNHNEAPHRNVLELLNGKRLNEVKEHQSD